MTHIRVGALLLSFGAVACAGPLQPDEPALRGTVVLSRSVGQASAPIVGTFRSVVDTLALSVTVGGTSQTIRHLFAPGELSFATPITLPAGSAAVAATILSNNGTRLFSGSSSAVIDRDGFSIDVPLNASTPVLTVFPDTVKLDSTCVQAIYRCGSVTVHNSGKDGLAWSVVQTPPNLSICLGQCSIQPDSGTLAANGDAKLLFRMPSSAYFDGPYPAGSVTYLFTSKEGTITLQWRYPGSG